MTIRLGRRAVLAAAPLLLGGRSAGAAWPERLIRLVVPFPAGSATDTLARVLAEPLSRGLGQPAVIENHAGGSGVVGTDIAIRAAPDGNTLLIYSTSSASVNPHALKRLPYDPIRNVAPQ